MRHERAKPTRPRQAYGGYRRPSAHRRILEPAAGDLLDVPDTGHLRHDMVRLPAKSPARRDGETLAATLSAVAVATAGGLVLLSHEFGQRAAHMAMHIAAMSVLAPAAAAACASILPRWIGGPRILWPSAVAQVALLWAWHVPAIERFVADSHGFHAAAHLTLFFSSFLFWSAVVRASDRLRWHAIAALLLSGKLTCLLSAVLVFSPRALYRAGWSAVQLGDQQLAGLLMITACPLSYLIAAVVIVGRLVNENAGIRPSGTPSIG
jgi:putative membrane protein